MATPGHPGVDRRGHRRALRRLRPAGRRHPDRVRPRCHGGGDRCTRPRPLRAGGPHPPRRLVARPGGSGQRRHDRASGRRPARGRDHCGHLVSPPGRVGPAQGRGGHLRRSPLRVRGTAHRDLPVAHLAGGPREGGRRRVRPGDDQLRECAVGGGDAGDRFGSLRRRLSHVRRRRRARLRIGEPGHQQPAAGVGGHRRGHRAAGGLALGRRPAHRGGRRARADPRVTTPTDGSGLGVVGPGHGCGAHAPTERDAAPEPVGALVARGAAGPV